MAISDPDQTAELLADSWMNGNQSWGARTMRLILIDNCSGYIFGDSADFAGGRAVEVIDACRTLDESNGVHGREYDEHGPGYRPAANETAYHVYRGSDAIPVVHDGQDQETIEAVVRDCDKVAVVLCRGPSSD
jgi:hypothetical protein